MFEIIEAKIQTNETYDKSSTQEKDSANSVNSKPFDQLLQDFLPKHLQGYFISHPTKREKTGLYEWDNIFEAKTTFPMSELSDKIRSLLPDEYNEVQNVFNPNLQIQMNEWVFVENKYSLKNCQLNTQQIFDKITRFCETHLKPPYPKSVHILLLVGNDELNPHSRFKKVYWFAGWRVSLSVIKISPQQIFRIYSPIEDFSFHNVLNWFHSFAMANQKNTFDLNVKLSDLQQNREIEKKVSTTVRKRRNRTKKVATTVRKLRNRTKKVETAVRNGKSGLQ